MRVRFYFGSWVLYTGPEHRMWAEDLLCPAGFHQSERVSWACGRIEFVGILSRLGL